MLHANGQKRDDVVKERNDWRDLQKTLEIGQLVFLDEASINCAMTRLRGWGDKHARVEDYVPDARFERTSILATVRLSGVNAPVTFKGTLNGDIFALYVRYVLAPTLNVGDVWCFWIICLRTRWLVRLILFMRGVLLFGFCLCIRRILILLNFCGLR